MNELKESKSTSSPIKSEVEKSQWKYKPFQHILHELVNLLELFENSPKQYKITLLNTIITTNMRLLEGVANSILNTFQIYKELYNALDRLPVKEKFDLALLLKYKQFPRNHLIENIEKVSSKRISLLHPKVKSLSVQFQLSNDSKKSISFRFEKEIDPNEEEVYQYLKNTFTFLDQFFLDEAQLTEEAIEQTLLDQVKLDDSTWGTMMKNNFINDIKKIQKILNIKIRLLSHLIS